MEVVSKNSQGKVNDKRINRGCYNYFSVQYMGLKNKLYGVLFFKYIRNYDIFLLVETFVEKKKKKKGNYFIDEDLKWILAVRISKFAMAKGGYLLGVRKCGYIPGCLNLSDLIILFNIMSIR